MSVRRSSRIAGVGGDVSPTSSTTSSVGRIGSPALSTRSKKKVNPDFSLLEQVTSRRRTLRGQSESDSISLASTAFTESTYKGSSRQSSPEKQKGSSRHSSTGRSGLKSDATTSDLPVSKLSHSLSSVAKSPSKQQQTDRRTLRSRIIETTTPAQSQETEQQQQQNNKKKASGSESSDEESALNTTVVAKQTIKSAETTPVKLQKENVDQPLWDSPKGIMKLQLENTWQAPGAIKDSPLKKITSPSNQAEEQSENKDDAPKIKSPVKLKENPSSESQQSSPTKRNLFSAQDFSDRVMAEQATTTKSPKVLNEHTIINMDGSISDASTELFIDECLPLETEDCNKKKLISPTKPSPKSSKSVLEEIGSTIQLSPIKEANEKEQLFEKVKNLSPEKKNSGMQQTSTHVSSSPRCSVLASPLKVFNLSPSRANKSLTSLDKSLQQLNKSEIFEEKSDESNTQTVKSPKNLSSSPLKTNSGVDTSNAENNSASKKLLFLEVEDSSDGGEDATKTPKKKSPKKANTSLERVEDNKAKSPKMCSIKLTPIKSDKTSSPNESNESETEEKTVQPKAALDIKSPRKSINLTSSGVIEETESDQSEIEVEYISPKKSQPTPVARILPQSKTEEIVMQPARKSVVQDSSKSTAKLQLKFADNSSKEIVVVQKFQVKNKSPEKFVSSPLKGKLITPNKSNEIDIGERAVQQTRKSSEMSTNLSNSKKREESKSPAKSKTPLRSSLQNSDKISPRKLKLDENSESEVESDRNTASKPINWRNKLEQKYKVKSNLAESSEDSDEEFEESGSGDDEKVQSDTQYEEIHLDSDSLESDSDEVSRLTHFKPLKTDWRSKMLKGLTGKEVLGDSGGSSEYESDGNSEEDSPKNVLGKKKYSTKSKLSHYFEQPRDDSEESESDDDSEESEYDEKARLAAFKPLKEDWRSATLKEFANKELIVDSSSDTDAVIDEEADSVESSDPEEVSFTGFRPLQADWRSENLKRLTQNSYPSSESSSNDEIETPAKKQKTNEISSANAGAIVPILCGKTKIPRSSSNNTSSNVAQASSSGSCDPKSQKDGKKRKSSNLSPSLKRTKLQQWTVIDNSDKNTHDIWGGEIVKEVVKKKNPKEKPELREQRQLELNKQVKALRNWQVTPLSPEKRTHLEQSKTEQLKQDPAQQSQSKKKKRKNKKKAQTNLDTMQGKMKDHQTNKKGKISEDIDSSDSEPIEQSFESSRKSAFEVIQEAMQSARREEEAKKKKRRERHERLEVEKRLSQQGKKHIASKASTKLPQDEPKKDTKLDSVKESKVPNKLPLSVLQQLEVKKEKTVVPVVIKDGDKKKRKRRKHKKKKNIALGQEPPVVNESVKSNITKFDVADPQTVQNTLSQSQSDKWRHRAFKQKKKNNPGTDLKLLKGKLHYLQKNQDSLKW